MSSNLPGGNLVATLYHTSGQGSCTELISGPRESGRIQLELRHWQQSGTSRPFPTGTPTRVTAESLPLATTIPAGDRIILAIGATSPEILPDPLKPTTNPLLRFHPQPPIPRQDPPAVRRAARGDLVQRNTIEE